MDGSDWDDEAEYPAAPLPAHERGWRHPSEIGASEWASTEPPLVIGRGLTAVTGVIGIALSLAVLWTMLPTHAGRSAVVSVRSTVSNPTPSAAAATTAPGLVTSGSVRPSAGPTSTSPTSTGPASTAPAPTEPDEPPMPTFRVGDGPTIVDGAVAVAVDGGQLLLTTASAVTGDEMAIVTADGALHEAAVLVVDQRSGLALLAPDDAPTEGLVLGDRIEPGDEVVVHGEQPVTLTIGAEGRTAVWPADAPPVREGAPVLNTRGELVALCTRGETGVNLVPVGTLDDLRRALGALGTPTVRMGVMLDDDPRGALTIAAVEPDGPAALAGLDVGDTIVAVDGEPVTDLDELAGILALHRPGDVIRLELECSDGTSLAVELTLARPKHSL